MSLRVAVVGGGRNCEHAVSLASAASVRRALAGRYDVVELTIAPDGRWHSAGEPLGERAAGLPGALEVLAGCDVVLPIVHGPHGEDGSLAALCDLACVPYAGSGLRAGALAMDKWATKLLAEALGILTASGRLLTRETVHTAAFEGPVVVKPVGAGSSHGVSLVREAAELMPALDAALALDDRVLVEELVEGREVDIAVLRRADGSLLVGPALEIVVAGGLFDTDHKYDGTADFRLPAQLSDAEHKELVTAALDLFESLGCAGVARFDFFLPGREQAVVLNEVNTLPGMTEQSQVPKMFAAVGLPYAGLLDELVRGALTISRP